MVPLGEVLEFAGRPERIRNPSAERFVTVRLNGLGAVHRAIGEGKTPVPFTGYRVKAGQFIYSRIDARNGAFAILPEALTGAVVSKDFPVFEIRDELIDRSYLLHYFRSGALTRSILASSMGATNRQRITEDRLLAFTVPMPSVLEQRRIAAILDQADALRAKRREVLAHLNSLTQSIFHDMFSGNDYPHSPLGALLQAIESGSSPVCEVRPAGAGEWGVLKLSAVTSGVFRPTENKALPADAVIPRPIEVREGDLLLTRKNTRELVGASALVGMTRPRLLLPDLIFRLVPCASRIDSAYLHALLMSPVVRSRVRQLAGGSAGSMPNISKARLAGLDIPVPPLEQQQRFRSVTRQIAGAREPVARAISTDREFFASLQARAFRGLL